jgi:putative ubiquitin-RnfH superfamily antitoxin RatB of RatAB toxin-antitoxin module
MSNKIIKIVEGDDNINVSVILNLTQLKALNNLLVEHNKEVPDMITYQEIQNLTEDYALRSEQMDESVFENVVRENVVYLCDVISRAIDEDITVTDAVERANVLLTIQATNNLYESMGLLEESKLTLRDQFLEHAKNPQRDSDREHFPVKVTVVGLFNKSFEIVVCNSQLNDNEEEEYPNRTQALHDYLEANDVPLYNEDCVVEDIDFIDKNEIWYVGS